MAKFDDWYWRVAGDTNVWSSARFAYVPPSDAAYQTWLSASNSFTPISDRPSLSQVMSNQRIPSFLGAGLAVVFSVAPALSSTYALDPVTLDQVGTVARDSASGLGLPGSLPAFVYPDINGVPVAFTGVQIGQLYQAMRDYVYEVNTNVAQLVFRVPGTMMPPTTTTI